MQHRVALRAVKDMDVLTWDVPPERANELRAHLEAHGWRVSIDDGDGPRRRCLPRVERLASYTPER